MEGGVYGGGVYGGRCVWREEVGKVCVCVSCS